VVIPEKDKLSAAIDWTQAKIRYSTYLWLSFMWSLHRWVCPRAILSAWRSVCVCVCVSVRDCGHFIRTAEQNLTVHLWPHHVNITAACVHVCCKHSKTGGNASSPLMIYKDERMRGWQSSSGKLECWSSVWVCVCLCVCVDVFNYNCRDQKSPQE
jgi:hypothetical protein